ncbi:thiopurine S-methyltransferase [Microbulbifer halophilus]|uniref:Thiopurine S-methyltransferase n=1 Tax=Microbulbifer halophilus TaxID=453963 RepID=A0ABW5EC15_9GAMM|nr:thiopurine S-methyltransferase [Microbulbifer halophilus]MCW8128537.1 thiopurine S-methyltransferase [Microbulbifer halophilus]
MEADFWHRKWANNETGFHEGEANALLVKHFGRLSIPEGGRVFLPLCGKTRDIAWLLSQGYRVAGAELSEVAIQQLFDELGTEPEVSAAGNLTHYRADKIDMFVGDIFQLSGNLLGQVHAVYDRAALVALPDSMREVYTSHLMDITGRAPQLLITFEYDQELMDGPPFSIRDGEVRQHYRNHYRLTQLERKDVPGGFKGQCAARESAWLLT